MSSVESFEFSGNIFIEMKHDKMTFKRKLIELFLRYFANTVSMIT